MDRAHGVANPLRATVAATDTAVSLVLGIILMERGDQYDDEHGTRYMAMRVGLQGLTLVLLVALFFARGSRAARAVVHCPVF